ncbi:uncharacterized protein FA14DRAFT_159998 [Meira miltonrushii]|uniref:Uncharacterized protein n=1 Tax=Meira miltonrushii TaxID=1280837 RepID=A0A316VLE8_9BASI|nr:uncharacterized protein FA14DRAFT_159998 [Meira miltonrushii]PWN38422.1 hypothetical protein FA14DRAFT_159998 [Meira miltonrushii]
MAATTMRRKGSSSGGDHSMGTQAGNQTTSHGKRASVGGGGTHRQRFVDPSLMMSTKGSDEGRPLGGAHAKNKSSDRLHRIGGGNSSTNLSHSKRSKSYSQIMNATGQSSNKSKLKRGKSEGQPNAQQENEDDEGWTSADQTTDTDTSGNPKSQDDSEEEPDEGLVFGNKNAKGKAKATAKTHEGFQIGNDANQASSEQITTPPVTQPDQTPLAKPVTITDDEPIPLTTPQSVSHQKVQITAEKAPDAQHTRQSSDETLAVTPREEASRAVSSSPEEQKTIERRPALLSRHTSSASTHTLTGFRDDVRGVTSSPISTRSAKKRMSLLPRESSIYAQPQLSTEYAFAGGRHGSEGVPGSSKSSRNVGHRSSDSNLGTGITVSPSDSSRLHDRISESTPHYRFGTTDSMERRRKSSVSSSRSSFINLPGVAPTLGTVSHDSIKAESTGAQTSRALEAMQRASIGAANSVSSQSAFSLPHDRDQARRSLSFEGGKGAISSPSSTGPSEAARLANKLRMTRGKSGDDVSTGASMPSTASQMLANSGTKYFMGIKGDGPTAKSLARYNKPTVSVFVNRQDDFKSAEETVERGSLFDENFTRASVGHAKIPEHEEEEGHGISSRDDSGTVTPSDGTTVRYVMDYGLSGPAIQKSQTIQALLATCIDNDEFESSFAPALANAAGLGDSGSHGRGISAGTYAGQGEGAGLGAGGIYINGPNATPLHFIHGLTNTNDSPFPLDESEMNGGGGDHGMLDSNGQDGEYVDAKNLRAVALTWAALNATKNHIVTRRYVDPMRESIQRVALAGGMNINPDSQSTNKNDLIGLNHHASGSHGDSYYASGRSGNSGAMTPGGTLKWGWRHLFQEHN